MYENGLIITTKTFVLFQNAPLDKSGHPRWLRFIGLVRQTHVYRIAIDNKHIAKTIDKLLRQYRYTVETITTDNGSEFSAL